MAFGDAFQSRAYHHKSHNDLKNKYNLNSIIYKDHPLNLNYVGIKEERDWMFDHKENLNSFFSYWKKCRKKYFKQ